MKKFIVTGAALVALAVPAVASANVNVDDQGVGFVGKGDVQTALGGIDDHARQSLHEQGKVKFTTGYTWSLDYLMQCSKTVFQNGQVKQVNTGTGHTIVSAPITQDAKVSANTNKPGKLTNGWDIGGFDGPTTTGASTYSPAVCPAGSSATSSISQVTNYGPRSGLQVTVPGYGTFDLPNTPVEAPVL